MASPRKDIAMTRRKELNRRINAENYRERLNFGRSLNQIEEIEAELRALSAPQTVFTTDGDIQLVYVAPEPSIIAAKKTVLDSLWKKINKILPDLKAVDMHAQIGLEIEEDEETPIMDIVEFKKRLAHRLMQDGAKIVSDDAVEEEVPSFLK